MVKEALASTQSLKGYRGDDFVAINKKNNAKRKQVVKFFEDSLSIIFFLLINFPSFPNPY